MKWSTTNDKSRVIRKPEDAKKNIAADKLCSENAYVLTANIAQSFLLFYPEFQVSRQFLSLHRPVCVGLGRKHQIPVISRRGSTADTLLRTVMQS